MTTVTAITAGLSRPSSTRLLTDRLTAALRRRLDATARIDTVELRELAHDVTDHLLVGFPSPRLRAVLDDVATSDGLILVTPTFTASYSGLFKSFVDVVDPDALRGKPILLAATGGTERHSLMLDHAMRPVMSYLNAAPVPTAVYAAGADWGNDSALADRVDRAAAELADAMAGRPPAGTDDPFTDPIPFEELLNRDDRPETGR